MEHDLNSGVRSDLSKLHYVLLNHSLIQPAAKCIAGACSESARKFLGSLRPEDRTMKQGKANRRGHSDVHPPSSDGLFLTSCARAGVAKRHGNLKSHAGKQIWRSWRG